MVTIRHRFSGKDLAHYEWGRNLLMATLINGTKLRLGGTLYEVVDRIIEGLDDENCNLVVIVTDASL
jgi:hypothetical protein